MPSSLHDDAIAVFASSGRHALDWIVRKERGRPFKLDGPNGSPGGGVSSLSKRWVASRPVQDAKPEGAGLPSTQTVFRLARFAVDRSSIRASRDLEQLSPTACAWDHFNSAGNRLAVVRSRLPRPSEYQLERRERSSRRADKIRSPCNSESAQGCWKDPSSRTLLWFE
jgi:hypothetical protein